MKDLKAKLEKLRADAKNFAHLSMSATEPEKRELFGRLADELAIEALELEQVVEKQGEVGSPQNIVDLNVLKERESG